MFFNGTMEYLLKTEFTSTLIGTYLKSSKLFPSKISIVISVLSLVVFNFTSLSEQNRTKIYFS